MAVLLRGLDVWEGTGALRGASWVVFFHNVNTIPILETRGRWGTSRHDFVDSAHFVMFIVDCQT